MNFVQSELMFFNFISYQYFPIFPSFWIVKWCRHCCGPAFDTSYGTKIFLFLCYSRPIWYFSIFIYNYQNLSLIKYPKCLVETRENTNKLCLKYKANIYIIMERLVCLGMKSEQFTLAHITLQYTYWWDLKMLYYNFGLANTT
jgi:hypothetical protein